MLRPISVRKDPDDGSWWLYDLKGGLLGGWPPTPVYAVSTCCWAAAMDVACALADFYSGRRAVGNPRVPCVHLRGGSRWI